MFVYQHKERAGAKTVFSSKDVSDPLMPRPSQTSPNDALIVWRRVASDHFLTTASNDESNEGTGSITQGRKSSAAHDLNTTPAIHLANERLMVVDG
jgi:hypothetical protein